ncbi:hypothetical protein CC80DRAFT_100774 [Byssothecium circinans]|uniref:Uncharacterized protein n=1 Tax=Byssothecium circinans TaxID=147558 RepID=A0A6A5UDE3_9PLEO|nr:hypothetical protein CC80DRAFT_100774 [Byssothecium circinans]
MSSAPSVTIHPSSEPLRFVREAGKVTAYLIPFPKPRIRGVEPEDIPDRFLIYTPPLPPLSKPAAGEKETHWHKTQRQWQEDVRKASVNKASITTWKGFKAGTTSLVHKGVAKTRSTNVEFIDRASGGALASEVEKEEEGQPAHVQATETEIPAELVADTPTSPSEASPAPISRTTASNTSSLDKDNKPTALEELTLIYPPSLPLSPEQIRTEFADTLLRTRASSRKDVLFASALLPFAATLDACLIVTFGGLTQVSGAWAYTSTRGALESKKIAKGLERGEQTALNNNNQEPDTESQISGCTCGHHEHDFGKPSTTSATPTPTPNVLEKATSYFTKTKAKDNGINLHLQQSPQLEILRRYLDLACLKREFNMFPAIEEAAGDVNEGSVLEAIGWRPVRRAGKDLEVDFKDRVEVLTPEEDEKYQVQEAREDVKRVFRKGAGEWVGWVKERGWVKEGKEKEKERK